MSIYYENPQFAKLPLELQNHIYAFMPPHPIVKILKQALYFIKYEVRKILNNDKKIHCRIYYCIEYVYETLTNKYLFELKKSNYIILYNYYLLKFLLIRNRFLKLKLRKSRSAEALAALNQNLLSQLKEN